MNQQVKKLQKDYVERLAVMLNPVQYYTVYG